ncbi:MAG TPA: DUF2460 domain-containing protein [Stellaceae bacterium]|jgi:uncharacterized protein (TIGR02217 family)|nr:DUF2460 domain-containing protein [Stellaceae bacterium]
MADIGIFPSLPGLAWSVTKTPTFQTRIQRAVSGRELRALDYPYPLWQFTLVFDLLRDNPTAGYDELRTLMGFFMLCQGSFGTFLFRDPSDHRVTGQQIGIGNASTTVFQLQRAMGSTLPGGGFLEPIVAPGVVSALYLDGITQGPGSYSVDPDTGLVTFSTAPGSGLIITADYSYYFRCRFIDDSYAFENFMFQLWQLKKLTFISVRQ